MADESTQLLDKRFVQKLQRLSFYAKRAATVGLTGEHRSERRGHSLEFADYRNYVLGDDFRTIDWNIYARLERLLVKLTEAQEAMTLHLLLDTSRSMDWGEPKKLLYAKRLVAALAYVALTHFDWITVAAFGADIRERFPAARGHGQMLPFLKFLEDLRPTSATNLQESLRSYAGYLQSGRHGIVVVVSDLLCPSGYEEGLRHLSSSRSDVILIHLLHPMEVSPQLAGDIQLIDAETGEPIEITVTPALLASYAERFQEWCHQIEEFCRRRGIHYLRIQTDYPVEHVMLSYLRRRRVLR